MKNLHLLVVGGASDSGSHMVKQFAMSGCQVTTLDTLTNGHRDTVMHFASFIPVGEFVKKPAMYNENTVTNTLNLLDAMLTHAWIWEKGLPPQKQ